MIDAEPFGIIGGSPLTVHPDIKQLIHYEVSDQPLLLVVSTPPELTINYQVGHQPLSIANHYP